MARRAYAEPNGPRRSRILVQFGSAGRAIGASQAGARANHNLAVPKSSASARRHSSPSANRRILAEVGARVGLSNNSNSQRGPGPSFDSIVASSEERIGGSSRAEGRQDPNEDSISQPTGRGHSFDSILASVGQRVADLPAMPNFSMSRFSRPPVPPLRSRNSTTSVEETAEIMYQEARADAARKVAEQTGDGAGEAWDVKRVSLLSSGVACQAPNDLLRVASAESPEWLEALTSEFSGEPYEIPDTAHRGITLRQLCRVISFFHVNCHRLHDVASQSQTYGIRLGMDFLNFYHVEHWLIKPATLGKRCGEAEDGSFVELVAASRQTPAWYVSHWWGEPHFSFVRCIEVHVGLRGLTDDTPFWVCAYANRQHSLDQEIANNPRSNSFYRAMQKAEGLLLVLDEENTELHTGPATPFSRIWCSFEQAVALTELPLKFDIAASRRDNAKILTDGLTAAEEKLNDRFSSWEQKQRREKLFPLQLIQAGLQVQLEKAKASHDRDRVHILNCLAERPLDSEPKTEHPKYVAINQRLRATFSIAVWRQALTHGQVRAMRLPELLAADTMRKSVVLCFKYMDKFVNDETLLDLERALPPSLDTLSLDFTFCQQMNNASVAGLLRPLATASGLGSSLRRLVLDFEACVRVGDGGLAALGQVLPRSLEMLDLNFKYCNTITDAGVAALATGIPASLQELHLDFYNCKKVGDAGIAAIAESTRDTKLTSLILNFDGCENISKSGMASLTLGFPLSLTTLDVSLEGCGEINDKALAVFARGLPTSLKQLPLSVLKLNFRGCGQITSGGVMTVSQALPRSLSLIQVDFSECGGISDDGVDFLANSLPNELTYLQLSFASCHRISNFSIAALGQNMPSSLRRLNLCFQGCTQLSDAGVQALVKCMDGLREFDADFTNTKVSDTRQICDSSAERPDQLARRFNKEQVDATKPFAFKRPFEPECDAKPAQPAVPARPTAPPK